jgi:hypothetical protein
MATVSDDGAGAERLRRAQRSVARSLIRDVRSLRRLILPTRLRTSVPAWIDAIRAVVEEYSAASATLAAAYYDGERESAGITGRFTVAVPGPPPDEQVEATLRWATKDLWPRDPEAAANTAAQTFTLDVRLEQAERKTEGAVERLVLNAGRQTIREAVQQDRGAVAYARAAALGACSFCKLMASRGAVFKDLDRVGREANERFTGDDSVIKFHNSCRCQPIPVFRGQQFQLSPHAAEWDRIYREYAAGHPGDQLRRFRQALAAHDQHPLPAAH